MPANEWTVRFDLATCHSISAILGWAELIYNHIAMRLTGHLQGKAIAVNPAPAVRCTRDAL